MPGPYGGKRAVVNGMSTVRDWSINDAHDIKKYVASNTHFGQGSRPGVQSWDGSFQHYGHTPVVMPGDLFSFLGYFGNGGPGPRYAGDAMCEQVVVNWNWGSGDILNTQVQFKGHLDLDEQGGDGGQPLDQSVPTVPMVPCTKIEYSIDGGAFEEWDNLVSAALTLTCALQSYVNSSTVVTVGGNCRLWTGQVAGPIAWSLAVTEQDVQRDLFIKGQSVDWKLYVTDVLFWRLRWGMVRDFTGLQASAETGAIIQQTCNVDMDGFDPTAGSYAASTGYIKKPDGTTWWPFGTGS